MKPLSKKFKIYYIPIFVGLIIALCQFVLSNFYTLTKWEGGGFGMYSEPNPHNSRIAGIILENSNGRINIRLNPPDPKLDKYIKTLNTEDKKKWDKLIAYNKQVNVFPLVSLTDEYIRHISNELLNINPKLKNRMNKGNIPIDAYFYVNQINISAHDKVFKNNKIYSKSLEL